MGRSDHRLHPLARITIVLAAAILITRGITDGLNAVLGPDYDRGSHAIRAVSSSVLLIGLVLLARRYLDGLPWVDASPASAPVRWRMFLLGIATFLVPMAVGLTICLLLGLSEITPRVSLADAALVAVQLVPLVLLYEALPEELVFRSYMYRNLTSIWSPWCAVAGQAVLFTAWGSLNGGGVTIDRAVLFLGVGVVLGCLRLLAGSVWAPIGFHLAFQTVAQLFGSIGDAFLISAPGIVGLLVTIVPCAVAPFVLRALMAVEGSPSGAVGGRTLDG